jgi:hypothetical protein
MPYSAFIKENYPHLKALYSIAILHASKKPVSYDKWCEFAYQHTTHHQFDTDFIERWS